MGEVITAVVPQRSRRGRVSVFVGGKFVLGIDEGLARQLGLEMGRRLEDEDIEELRQADAVAKVYEAALRFMAYRPRSEQELRKRLMGKKFDHGLVDQVIERLRESGYVDDSDFASFWIENRNSFSPRGKRLLRQELRLKGVEREVIDAALDQPDQPADEEKAMEVARRKLPQYRGEDWLVFRRKMGGFLARRGFDYEAIDHVTRTLWVEISGPDPEIDFTE